MKTVKTMVYGMTVLRDMLPTVSSTLIIFYFNLSFLIKLLRCVDVFCFVQEKKNVFTKMVAEVNECMKKYAWMP